MAEPGRLAWRHARPASHPRPGRGAAADARRVPAVSHGPRYSSRLSGTSSTCSGSGFFAPVAGQRSFEVGLMNHPLLSLLN